MSALCRGVISNFVKSIIDIATSNHHEGYKSEIIMGGVCGGFSWPNIIKGRGKFQWIVPVTTDKTNTRSRFSLLSLARR